DKITGKVIQPVTTGQIYWGSVPFIVIQLFMVAAIMLFPGMVMHYKGGQSTVDPASVKIEIESNYGTNIYGDESSDPGVAFK
ncbi:C4-dicarboxylate ABC transporter, partial [Bordetella parapertussis]|nr:C4-dicarboxylate ABC transporter [Bordetella parapertussis]